jgi:hypothetical protein
MNDHQQSPAPAETAAPEADTPTLEQIAKELSVEEQAKQFVSSVQPQPYQQQNQAPYQFQAPDPITDPEGYRSYIVRQNQAMLQLDTATQQLASKVNQWERLQAEQKNNRDVDDAVQKVNAKLNLDPLLTESLLEATYKKDANFRKIWDNRDRNPQAKDKALEVLAQKFAGQFTSKQDPQIAKNLLAAKSSQQTMATTQKIQNEGVPTDPVEFDRWYQNMMNRG